MAEIIRGVIKNRRHLLSKLHRQLLENYLLINRYLLVAVFRVFQKKTFPRTSSQSKHFVYRLIELSIFRISPPEAIINGAIGVLASRVLGGVDGEVFGYELAQLCTT